MKDNIVVLHPKVRAQIENIVVKKQRLEVFEENVAEMIRRDMASKNWSLYHGEETSHIDFAPDCSETLALEPSACCVCGRVMGKMAVERGLVFWPSLTENGICRYLCHDCHRRWHNENDENVTA